MYCTIDQTRAYISSCTSVRRNASEAIYIEMTTGTVHFNCAYLQKDELGYIRLPSWVTPTTMAIVKVGNRQRVTFDILTDASMLCKTIPLSLLLDGILDDEAFLHEKGLVDIHGRCIGPDCLELVCGDDTEEVEYEPPPPNTPAEEEVAPSIWTRTVTVYPEGTVWGWTGTPM